MLSCLNRLTFDLDFWHGSWPWPNLGWDVGQCHKSKSNAENCDFLHWKVVDIRALLAEYGKSTMIHWIQSVSNLCSIRLIWRMVLGVGKNLKTDPYTFIPYLPWWGVAYIHGDPSVRQCVMLGSHSGSEVYHSLLTNTNTCVIHCYHMLQAVIGFLLSAQLAITRALNTTNGAIAVYKGWHQKFR